MAKLYYEDWNVRYRVQQSLNDACNHIDMLVNMANNLKTTDDFSENYNLEIIKNKFRNAKNDLHNLYDWVSKSMNDINGVNSNIDSYADSLPSYTVENRKEFIK